MMVLQLLQAVHLEEFDDCTSGFCWTV